MSDLIGGAIAKTLLIFIAVGCYLLLVRWDNARKERKRK